GVPVAVLYRLLHRRHDHRRTARAPRRVEQPAVTRTYSCALDAPGAGLVLRRRSRHRRGVRADPGLHLFLHAAGVAMTLDLKVPSGPLAENWDRHRFEAKLVNPANRRRYSVIVVGTGLAGASAASS